MGSDAKYQAPYDNELHRPNNSRDRKRRRSRSSLSTSPFDDDLMKEPRLRNEDRSSGRKYKRDQRDSSRENYRKRRDKDRDENRQRRRHRREDSYIESSRDEKSIRHHRSHNNGDFLKVKDKGSKNEKEYSIEPSIIRRRGPLPSQEASFANKNNSNCDEDPEKPPTEKPNFGTTGHLAAASNSIVRSDGRATALKYHEPSEASRPAAGTWRMFVFAPASKNSIEDELDLSARSCWLIGRDREVADIWVTPDGSGGDSVSKQHAVVQFRLVEKRNEFGDRVVRVKPYLLDLQSANGTSLNGEEIRDSRYYELKDKDLVQFGDCEKEYVIMNAKK